MSMKNNQFSCCSIVFITDNHKRHEHPNHQNTHTENPWRSGKFSANAGTRFACQSRVFTHKEIPKQHRISCAYRRVPLCKLCCGRQTNKLVCACAYRETCECVCRASALMNSLVSGSIKCGVTRIIFRVLSKHKRARTPKNDVCVRACAFAQHSTRMRNVKSLSCPSSARKWMAASCENTRSYTRRAALSISLRCYSLLAIITSLHGALVLTCQQHNIQTAYAEHNTRTPKTTTNRQSQAHAIVLTMVREKRLLFFHMCL